MRLIDTLASGFLSPQGLALHGSTLCVADTGNHQIVTFDITTTPIALDSRLGGEGNSPSAEGFLFPRAVCFLTGNDIIVADTRNQHLDRYSKTGNNWSYLDSISSFSGVPSVGYIVDIVPEGPSSVLILDETSKQLIQVDIPTGNASSILTSPNWQRPMSVRTGGGYTWLVDADAHRVFRYDAAGAEFEIGSFGVEEGFLSRPLGIAVDTVSSSIYVTEGDTGRVSRFSFEGQHIESLHLPIGYVHEPHSIQIDSTGNLWIADAGSNRIYRVDTGSNGPRPVLIPSRLDYGVVGEGYQLPFGVILRNEGDLDLDINAISVSGNGFALTNSLALPQTVTPGGEFVFSVTFQPTDLGPSNGILEIRAQHEQTPILSCQLYGVGATVAPLALVLVVDRSGSMNQSGGLITKVERLRRSVELMAGLFSDRPGDEIALVSFSSQASLDQNLSSVSDDLVTAVNAIQPAGTTSIGRGLQSALQELGNTDIQRKAIIVLTDGKENTPPYIEDPTVQTAIGASGSQIFSIGLGLPEYIDVEKLAILATSNNGYFQVTDERFYLLPKFLVQIFSDVVGEQLALDPVLKLTQEKEESIPVSIASNEKSMTVVVTWDDNERQCHVDVETPGGTRLQNNDYEWRRTTDGQIILKALVQQPGQWKVHIRAPSNLRNDANNRIEHKSARNVRFRPPESLGAEVEVSVAVLVDSPNRIRWETIPANLTDEKVSLPTESKANAIRRRLFPEITSVPRISRVRKGSSIGIIPVLSTSDISIKPVGGEIQVNPPKWSLMRLTNRVRSVDIDNVDTPPSRPTGIIAGYGTLVLAFLVALLISAVLLAKIGYSFIALFIAVLLLVLSFLFVMRLRTQTSTRSYRWVITQDSASAEIPLDGLDGVYAITARLDAELADGTQFQREHRFDVLVEP